MPHGTHFVDSCVTHLTCTKSQVLYAMRGEIKLGILPLLFFQNGHSYFTQKLHERRNIVPYVVHATYQYGDGAIFPFGKRQRMREAGLWLMDGPEYTAGNYLAVSWAGATRPEYRVALDQVTRHTWVGIRVRAEAKVSAAWFLIRYDGPCQSWNPRALFEST